MDRNMVFGVVLLWVYGAIDVMTTLGVIAVGKGTEANPLYGLMGIGGLVAYKIVVLFLVTKYFFANKKFKESTKVKALVFLIVFFCAVCFWNLIIMLS